MSVKVRNKKVEGIIRGWRVSGVIASEFLIDLCAERYIFQANTYSENKLIHI